MAATGSTRESLILSLETVCLQALAHVLSVLDRNFNLALAPASAGAPAGGDEGVVGALWVLLANNAAVVKPARVAIGASIKVQPPLTLTLTLTPTLT